MSTIEAPPPVKVSGQAHKALADTMRRWSGWPTAKLHLDPPPSEVSPFGSTLHSKREFHINVDALCRNPNRVLNNVTPFRLRQEAFISGVMLHEAGHARHSLWRPRTAEACVKFVHGSYGLHEGEPVNKPTLLFAQLMEEARIEGLMVRDAAEIGALGLEWTLRAAGAALAAPTVLAYEDNQKIIDVIESWVLRAGKQKAYAHWHPSYTLPEWVGVFDALLFTALKDHFARLDLLNYVSPATEVNLLLSNMLTSTDDRGTHMVDTAREILDLLFPETEPDDAPTPSGGCAGAQEGLPEHELEGGEGEGGSSDEAGEQGSGDTKPEDEGIGSIPGAGSAGEDEGEYEDESQLSDETSSTAVALAKVEKQAAAEQGGSIQDEVSKAPPQGQPGTGASAAAAPTAKGGTWREPTAVERDIRRGAERFLRDMVDPTTSSKVRLSSSPSSAIDPAAYTAWKAAGQTTEPHFFRQTKRTTVESPPVRIAVLVDKSSSMDSLTEPSAVLSWALAAAAFDLRNFAGRGVQVESCLIHWGSDARVVQANGEMMPGLLDEECSESTVALLSAFDLVEQQMPGFFDVPEKPANRLLVHFTDWVLGSYSANPVQVRALQNGVNTLSVVPHRYDHRRGQLSKILAQAQGAPGKHMLLRYDEATPSTVWTQAAELLSS